ncbi:MAG TPA: hypothetical protein VEQ85_08155 [Lacipirellulaceae bacterium]|nr:hypothetical protein [Lacipirellulaceae bacterium]
MRRQLWRCAQAAAAALALGLATTDRPAWAGDYAEAVHGDLSDLPASPTSWPLSAGSNVLTGSAGLNLSTFSDDFDLVTFVVPDGHRLDAMTLDTITVGDRLAFFGLQAGPAFLDSVGNAMTGANLIGWRTLSSANDGLNLLAEFRARYSPARFDIPLPSGSYTMVLQDTDGPVSYGITLGVSVLPEPSGWALAGAAACGAGVAGRLRRAGNRTR